MRTERIPTRMNPIVEVGTVRDFYTGKAGHCSSCEPHCYFDVDSVDSSTLEFCPHCSNRIVVINNKVFKGDWTMRVR